MGGAAPLTCQEWGSGPTGAGISFDVSAGGARRLMAWAVTGTGVFVCQVLISHPRRNDPLGKLKFHWQNLNTPAWETRHPAGGLAN
ncbi:hypothetical protein PBY51_022909 [Eleginops maclovinus]|uniref:Uncharacterized protein n=1 Tax=Eleginops maclovinus TaxID=56733 RepID=A0AAN8ANM6_ELEMC|nr:hypothetical protein PBY51_022909 [Eleginops maclovinus]